MLGFCKRIGNGPSIKNNLVRNTPTGLFGSPTETTVLLEGKEVPSLLDTGSTVSTLCESYYRKHLEQSIPLKEITSLLDIECAGGTQLPYSGYIESNISTPGVNNYSTYVLLIIPDSNYNQQIPLLIGTNILDSMLCDLQNQHGERFLQNANLKTPWYLTFRCITLREKELSKNQNRLALVKSLEPHKITTSIPPNTTLKIQGNLDKELLYKETPSFLQSSPLASDNQDLDIEPQLYQYIYKNNGIIDVNGSNVTTKKSY